MDTIAGIDMSAEGGIHLKSAKLVLLVLIVFFLSGCAGLLSKPKPEDADLFLKNNRYDIDIIVDYLKAIDTDHAYIGRNRTTITYEFEDHVIESEEVKDSLQNLWRAGCQFISIHNAVNTVNFELWDRTMGNVSFGIACTLDGRGFPKAELQTECEAISNGWFCYYSDYEEYRKNPSKYDEMWDSKEP